MPRGSTTPRDPRTVATGSTPQRIVQPPPLSERPPRALAYLRVSTLAQDRDGKNLDGQLDEVRSYCARKGYALHAGRDVYEDTVSGARTDRNGYYRLLGRIEKENADVVVAWNVSRLGRNSLDGAWLMVKCKEHGLRIETAQEGVDFTQDPASEFMFDVLTAAAKLQRNTILQDMMRGKRTGHKRGKWVNGEAPFGYRAVGPRGAKELRADPVEAPVVLELFTRYVGGESQAALAHWLQGLGLRRAARGGVARRWAPNVVARVLTHPVYVGWVAFGGDSVRGRHAPLVPQSLFDLAQRRRALLARRYPGRPRAASAE